MRCRWYCLLSPPLAIPAARRRADDVSTTVGKDTIEFKVGFGVVAKYAHRAEVVQAVPLPGAGPGGVPVTRAWPIEKGCPARPPPTTSTRNRSGSATAT